MLNEYLCGRELISHDASLLIHDLHLHRDGVMLCLRVMCVSLTVSP